MPSMTREELKDKYPMMYRVYKTAEDYSMSPEIMKEELLLITRELIKDESRREEMLERLAIFYAMIANMIDMVELTQDFYREALENYNAKIDKND